MNCATRKGAIRQRSLDASVTICMKVLLSALVAQLDASLICDHEVPSSSPPGRQHSFVGIAHAFYGQTLSSAYSRSAVVSVWRKNVLNTG